MRSSTPSKCFGCCKIKNVIWTFPNLLTLSILFILLPVPSSAFELSTSHWVQNPTLSKHLFPVIASYSHNLYYPAFRKRHFRHNALFMASSSTTKTNKNVDNNSSGKNDDGRRKTSNNKNSTPTNQQRKSNNTKKNHQQTRNTNKKGDTSKLNHQKHAENVITTEYENKLDEMANQIKNNSTFTQEFCDEIIGLCVAVNDWDEVLHILDVMKTQGLTQQSSTYRSCLNQCYKVANADSAMSILSTMKQANIRPEGIDIGIVVAIHCKLGNWRRAMHLIKQYAEQNEQLLEGNTDENDSSSDLSQNQTKSSQKYVVPIENYNAVIFHMAKSKHWKEAIQFQSLMESSPSHIHPSPQLTTYNYLLEACSNAAQPEQAMRILHIMSTNKEISPNTHSYNLVIAACLKKRQWRRAIQILEMMNASNPPVPQTTVTYNSVISCCSKAGEVRPAMSLFQTMRKRKVKPDTVTYNALMSACAANYKTWKQALQLLDELHREPGVDPDVVTYTIALRACAKGGMTSRALAMFQMMKDRRLALDVHAYTSIMDVCAKAAMWKQSLNLLDEMRSKGIAPNGFTYSVAIAACGKGGQWERSLELLHQMKEKGIEINTITYNSAISALANASNKNMRQKQKALRSREYLSDSSSSISTMLTTFDTDDEDQLWRKALNLIDQMKADDVQPDAITYSSAIKACGAAGKWKEALEIITIMQRGGPSTRPNLISYTNAITACGRSGRHEEALRLFNDMKNDGVQPDRVSYNALIFALKTANQAEMVFQLWNEMCGKVYISDDKESDNNNAMIATATPDAKKIAPDIITVTDVINALERSSRWREQSDLVFEEAVKRNLLFKSDSLDTIWEVDLTGMSFPVAHAAIRFALKRVYVSLMDENKMDDLNFITGIGVASQNQRGNNGGGGTSNGGDGGGTPVALREFIRDSLRNDFEPPIFCDVPKRAPGTIVIYKKLLEKWLKQEQISGVELDSQQ